MTGQCLNHYYNSKLSISMSIVMQLEKNIFLISDCTSIENISQSKSYNNNELTTSYSP